MLKKQALSILRLTGAIYPFSEADVSCIIQERYKDKGPAFCGSFFAALQAEVIELLTPKPLPEEANLDEDTETIAY